MMTMADDKINIALLKEQMQQNAREHEDTRRSLDEIKTILRAMDSRFASKWVERAITAIIVAIVAGALYAIAQSAGVPIR